MHLTESYAPHSPLDTMRRLRQDAERLSHSVVEDLIVFLHPHDGRTFMRLPSKGPEGEGDIGVTVTCTGLMTLGVTKSCEAVYGVARNSIPESLGYVFDKILAFRWASSKLPENNAFTTAMVLRAAGTLCEAGYADTAALSARVRNREDRDLDDKYIATPVRRFNGKSLAGIAQTVAEGLPESLTVLEYPPTPAIGYWLVDGIDNLRIPLGTGAWKTIAAWSAMEFSRQVSLVTAEHDALMDPVALAMAACLCKRLRNKAAREKRLQEHIIPNLPSDTELQKGISIFIGRQGKSGIWEKYFPLFHYPGAGSNHCWSFEVLEAILNEYPSIIEQEDARDCLGRAVRWCEEYRLEWLGNSSWRRDDKRFRGWNSGGQQVTLQNREPESWATGVVHMFLRRLRDCLSAAIRRHVLHRYDVTIPPKHDEDKDKWKKETIDTEIRLLGELQPRRLMEIVEESVIKPIRDSGDQRCLPKGAKRSALLFGPPGTGKTRFVKAIAHAIGWAFLEVNPTAFLSKGLEGIYVQSKELFDDLRDLYRTVVFFDEMDAMLQRRVDEAGRPQLTVEQQFLTTSMLPQLAELYDDKKVFFFVATNYGKTFDAAIVRPGRFDMLLFMGPPTWRTKRDHLTMLAALQDETRRPDMEWTLGDWVRDNEPLGESLSLATIGEMQAMMKTLCKGKALDVAIADGTLTRDVFRQRVQMWHDERFTLCKDAKLREQYNTEKDTSEIR